MKQRFLLLIILGIVQNTLYAANADASRPGSALSGSDSGVQDDNEDDGLTLRIPTYETRLQQFLTLKSEILKIQTQLPPEQAFIKQRLLHPDIEKYFQQPSDRDKKDGLLGQAVASMNEYVQVIGQYLQIIPKNVQTTPEVAALESFFKEHPDHRAHGAFMQAQKNGDNEKIQTLHLVLVAKQHSRPVQSPVDLLLSSITPESAEAIWQQKRDEFTALEKVTLEKTLLKLKKVLAGMVVFPTNETVRDVFTKIRDEQGRLYPFFSRVQQNTSECQIKLLKRAITALENAISEATIDVRSISAPEPITSSKTKKGNRTVRFASADLERQTREFHPTAADLNAINDHPNNFFPELNKERQKLIKAEVQAAYEAKVRARLAACRAQNTEESSDPDEDSDSDDETRASQGSSHAQLLELVQQQRGSEKQ